MAKRCPLSRKLRYWLFAQILCTISFPKGTKANTFVQQWEFLNKQYIVGVYTMWNTLPGRGTVVYSYVNKYIMKELRMSM